MAGNFSTDEVCDLRASEDRFVAGQGKRYAFLGPKAGIVLNIAVVFSIIFLVLAMALVKQASHAQIIEAVASLLPIFILGVVLAGLSALAEFLEEFFSEAHSARSSSHSPLTADIADVLAFGLTIASVAFFGWGLWRLGWILIPDGGAQNLACADC
jgi:hypothetical protein